MVREAEVWRSASSRKAKAISCETMSVMSMDELFDRHLQPHRSQQEERDRALSHRKDSRLIQLANDGIQSVAKEAARRLAGAGVPQTKFTIVEVRRPEARSWWQTRKAQEPPTILEIAPSDPRVLTISRRVPDCWHLELEGRDNLSRSIYAGKMDITADGCALQCVGHSHQLGTSWWPGSSWTVDVCIDPHHAGREAKEEGGPTADRYLSLAAADLHGRAYKYQDWGDWELLSRERPVRPGWVYLDELIAKATAELINREGQLGR